MLNKRLVPFAILLVIIAVVVFFVLRGNGTAQFCVVGHDGALVIS